MLITILGPDGTGKTTLAKALADKTDGLDYVYFGGSNESRRYRIFERFIKSDLSNFFLRIIRKALRVINDYDVYYQAKRNHIISDRCPIDNYIITKIQGRKIRTCPFFTMTEQMFATGSYIETQDFVDQNSVFRTIDEILKKIASNIDSSDS